jgi:2-dehydropantoate 2-reductase
MRIVVVGAGGVGGLIGGLLAHSGVDVAFLARGSQLTAMRSQGLRVHSPRADFHLPRVTVSDDPSQLAAADVVLVAVKAWQVGELAPFLGKLLKLNGFAVPLENGVEAADVLAKALGHERVVGGLCALLSWIEEPGVIRHNGAALRVVMGERDGSRSTRLEALAAQLTAAQIDVEITADISAASWEKFLFIASFGGVAAVARAPAGVVRSVPETRALLVSAMEEVARLAVASGVELRTDAVTRALKLVDAMPAEATASMQRDLLANRPSELHDQSGAIVRLARERGVPVPTHTFLLGALLPQDQAARNSSR